MDKELLDLLGWVLLFVMFASAIITSTGAAYEARRSFGIMGNRGAAKYVVSGIVVLAAIFYLTVFVIVFQRLLFFTTGDVLSLDIRTAIFYILFGMVSVGFSGMAWGFRKQADVLTVIRARIMNRGLLPPEVDAPRSK